MAKKKRSVFEYCGFNVPDYGARDWGELDGTGDDFPSNSPVVFRIHQPAVTWAHVLHQVRVVSFNRDGDLRRGSCIVKVLSSALLSY